METEDFSKIVYIGQLFLNDLKHMHLHAVGPNFDTIHSITQDLYDVLENQLDDIAEFSMTRGNRIQNLSDVKSFVDCETEYTPLTIEMFDWKNFCECLLNQGKIFLDALEESDLPGYVKDEYLDFWNKELYFKNALRLVVTNGEIITTDEDSSCLDAYVLETSDEIDSEGPLPTVSWPDLVHTSNFNADPAAIKYSEPEDYEQDEEDEGSEERAGYIKPFDFGDDRFDKEDEEEPEENDEEKSQNINGWTNEDEE